MIDGYTFHSPIDHLLYLDNSSTLFAVSSSHLHQLHWSTTNQSLLLLHRRIPLHSTLDQTDRGVSVLIYYPARHLVLVCARSDLGHCVLYDADDISRVYELDSSIETNKLGCESGCFTYLAESNVIRTALPGYLRNRSGNIIYTTIDLDKDLYHFNMHYQYQSNDHRLKTTVKFLSNLTLGPEFIYGFDDALYSYYLTKSSRLARSCQAPITMPMTYEEIPLFPCNPRQKSNQVTGAFYSHSLLYVIYENTLCVYSLGDIELAFNTAKVQCHMGHGYRLKYLVENGKDRIKCERNEEQINSVKDECRWQSYQYNSFMNGSIEVTGNLIYQSLDHSVRLVFIFVKYDLIILGTSDGQILKFIQSEQGQLNLLHRLIYPEKLLGQHYAIDEKHQSLIIAVGTDLHRYAYDSCSLYDTCESCVTSRRFDHRICQWYQGQCVVTSVDSIESLGCPPHIDQIQPINASVNTEQVLLNISGAFASVTMDQMKVVVTFPLPNQNQYFCLIKTLTNNSLTCLLFVPKQPMEGEIAIYIQPAKNLTLTDTDIAGWIEYSHKFHVYIPKPMLTPNFGPGAGGTKIRIQHLSFENRSDFFSTMKIFLGEENCPIIRYNHSLDSIECISQACPDDFQRLPLKIFVDNRPWLLEETFFQCRLNPVVFDWNPKKITVSGGYQMWIDGENLDVVQNPRMKLINTSSNNEWISPCTTISSSQMNCTTPIIHQERKFPLPLDLNISFLMDNMHVVPKEEILTVVNDPIYYPFQNSVQQINGTGVVHFQGSNLASSHTVDQIDIRIDHLHNACIPVNFTETDLFCALSKSAVVNFKSLQPIVEIFVGSHLNFSMGRIFFDNSMEPLSLVVSDSSSLSSNAIRFDSWTMFVLLFLSAMAMFVLLSTLILTTYRRLYRSSHELRHKTNSPAVEFQSLWNDFEQRWHLNRENISIHEKIGHGCFTDIYRGQLRSKRNNSTDVLIKVSRDQTSTSLHEFLMETHRTKKFSHQNVLSMLGIVWDFSYQAMVVFPHMINGDLRSYLANDIHQPKIKQLLTWAIQIADGMEYLASHKFVHRDLAARNCLLDEKWCCRIADFSLNRVSLERDYCRMPKNILQKKRSGTGVKRIPIRWLSPEAIDKSIFSTQSDVWAYGVVLWEIFNQAKMPYSSINDEDILRHIKGGYRMSSSGSCPPVLYRSVMVPCWHINPIERPSFKKLANDLRYILDRIECEQTEPGCSSAEDEDTTIVQRYPVDKAIQNHSTDSTSSSNDHSSTKLYAAIQSIEHRTMSDQNQPVNQTKMNIFKTTRLLPEYTETSIVQISE